MPTLSKMAVWPVGYFRRACSWLLKNRREVGGRVDHIIAELRRIGFVRVVYEEEQLNDGSITVNENPVGFSITEGTSLERLLRAYIAGGGNPMDVSMFLQPDSTGAIEVTAEEDTILRETQPQGGVAAPQSVDYNSPVGAIGPDGSIDDTGYGDYRGGYVKLHGYYPARQRGRIDRGAFDSDLTVRTVDVIRSWANQTIKTRLQDIEWRILKLADLREQLNQEFRTLLEGFGESLAALGNLDNPEVFMNSLRISVLMAEVWDLIYESTPGATRSFQAKKDTVGLLEWTFEDLPPEVLFKSYS